MVLQELQPVVGAAADRDEKEDEEEEEVLEEEQEWVDDEPSSIEYTAACANGKAFRCSQWQRACISRATDVGLAHYGLGKRGAEALAASLVKHVCIRSLDLSDNGLGGEGVTSVLSALQQRNAAPALEVLVLRQNQAGQEGADAVAGFLRGSRHRLASLDFASNALGTKGATTIAEALAANATLTALSLDSNEIDSEGVEQLAKALGGNRTLTSLSLEWNSVGKEGGMALAAMLGHDDLALSVLNLGWNGLGDEGVRLLARALELKPSGSAMRDVRLHHNRLSAEAAVPLSKALKSLAVLDVSGNALGEGGASVLLLAQQELEASAPAGSGGGGEAGGEAGGGGGGEGAEEGQPPPPRCLLKMEDVCVRPDTPLAGLLLRAAAGDAIPKNEMQASGVQTAAAVAVKAAKPPATLPKSPKSGKKQAAPGEEPWVRDPSSQAPGGQAVGGGQDGGKKAKKSSGKKK